MVDRMVDKTKKAPEAPYLYRCMAERAGFEPAIQFPVWLLSRELVSATHPPLRNAVLLVVWW